MNYQINRDHYHRFDVVEVGKLPPRSYFIPFSNRNIVNEVSTTQKRYASDKVRCLNGSWDFKFYPDPSRLPDQLDTQMISFDTIDVPSCWQFRGYDRPFYVNTRYQFPYRPPHIPQEDPVGKVFTWIGSDEGIKPRWTTPKDEYNFVGVYRKEISVADSDRRYILSFLGVCSCMDLYVNGQYVGYSEGSHNTAEFDVSAHFHPGMNELLVVVRRWCNGSYLECQDMFRNNGIFRDVLLYEMDRNDIWDISVDTVQTDAGYTANVCVQLDGTCDLTVSLCGHGLDLQRQLPESSGTVKVVFPNLTVKQWNAESPVLYDLFIQTENSCVRHRVGFKTVQIAQDVFTLNGQKIKLKGVNHHDTHPKNGYTLSAEDLEHDVQICKAYNINTIRTSHYPPDPMLLELCDEYGIYVVDETDLETHGTFAHQFPPTYNSISHDPRWAMRYLDRVARMYHRDKNHPCVTMWSLGNEAGGYHNTDLMYEWLKQRTSLPIHYESVIHSKRVAYDVGSEMYPSVEKVRAVGLHQRKQKQLNDRPYFLCEYAHAMGVGPGAAELYWEQIYSFENLMGGCVWEMVDHAVLHEDGSYTYGGDHGEWEHDGNFCVDGLFYPDRTPSTGAKLIRHIYRPIRVKHLEGNRFEIFNTTGFTQSDAYCIEFVLDDGEAVTPKHHIPPMKTAVVEIAGFRQSVTVVVSKDGEEISREQIRLQHTVAPFVEKKPGIPSCVDFDEAGVVIVKNGKKLTASEPYTILYRAPTDNDVNLAGISVMNAHICQKSKHLSTTVESDAIVVKTEITCKGQKFLCEDRYENCEEGVLVTSILRCVKGRGMLPRFGKAFRLDDTFDQVQYFGRNAESYCDMKEHAQVALVSCKVCDMTEPNIKPQESGNRCDCEWVRISDGESDFLFKAVEKPFELGVKPYTDEALLSMKHRADELRTGTYVTLSAFQMGIGTGSCGPSTRKEYCYDAAREYRLQFVIV